jgi:hypothetical protein
LAEELEPRLAAGLERPHVIVLARELDGVGLRARGVGGQVKAGRGGGG